MSGQPFDMLAINETLLDATIPDRLKVNHMRIGSAQLRIDQLNPDPNLFIGNIKLKIVKCEKKTRLLIDVVDMANSAVDQLRQTF